LLDFQHRDLGQPFLGNSAHMCRSRVYPYCITFTQVSFGPSCCQAVCGNLPTPLDVRWPKPIWLSFIPSVPSYLLGFARVSGVHILTSNKILKAPRPWSALCAKVEMTNGLTIWVSFAPFGPTSGSFHKLRDQPTSSQSSKHFIHSVKLNRIRLFHTLCVAYCVHLSIQYEKLR
jgi:hypothetical protein